MYIKKKLSGTSALQFFAGNQSRGWKIYEVTTLIQLLGSESIPGLRKLFHIAKRKIPCISFVFINVS